MLHDPATDDRTLGVLGERVVARVLRRRGFRILGMRLATRDAELDVCALDGETLVAIEVKTGRLPVDVEPEFDGQRALRWRPGHRFRFADLERVRRATARLADKQQRAWRVDLVELVLTPTGTHVWHHVDLREPLGRPPSRWDPEASMPLAGPSEPSERLHP